MLYIECAVNEAFFEGYIVYDRNGNRGKETEKFE